MSGRLRAQYEEYLGRFGLKPRPMPPLAVREAGLRKLVRIQYEEAISRDDPMAESILRAYEDNRERSLAEPRHPAVMAIDAVAAEIEATIRALPVFAKDFHDEVFVGEFPTGSVNCETVRVDGGYLVLVNSGALTMLQQAIGFLCRGDADHPGAEKNAETEAGVAAVLAAYIEHGDPFYGPRPVNGGMRGVLGASLSHGAKRFVIAHEYGHILAGHLKDAETVTIPTKVGPVEALRKQHDEEFEADEIGYRLTLGVGSYADFDLARIDAGAASSDLKAMHEAVALKALIAAPFVPLTVDLILGRFTEGARALTGRVTSPETHPPADDRIEKLLSLQPGKDPRQSGYINIPFLLLPAVDRIAGGLLKRFFKPAIPSPDDAEAPVDVDEDVEAEDDLMAAVGAVHHGDYRQAALLATDAFEDQRTILEPDDDVVRRELVRAALGRPKDVARTLLDRHKDRRAMEQFLGAARRDPIAQWSRQRLGRSDNRPIMLPRDLGSEPPAALAMVVAALTKARARGAVGPELELLGAIVAAWPGERAESLAAFEAALGCGVADAEGRLARYVALEKRAIAMQLRLDIQEMLTAVAQQALDGPAAANKTADLVKSYVEYLGIPLGPIAQRLIDGQSTPLAQ